MKPVDKKTLMAKRALMAKKALMARKAKASAVKKKRRIRQSLDRFIVIATNLSNAPRDTSGWTASLTNAGVTTTADFDDFGVARFPTITTLTTVPYLLRIRDANGNSVVSRNVPADREFFIARF
ncbi:hypothetical protein NST99_11335 [Paenibacillus sp. FSL L8-0470]|uniref:hypothetical protein n=1 Tax=unclassified Paenibacillus TaxID=185978 RepID=UPI0030FAEDCB